MYIWWFPRRSNIIDRGIVLHLDIEIKSQFNQKPAHIIMKVGLMRQTFMPINALKNEYFDQLTIENRA